MSSLCIHHLNGTEKQALFAAIAARLSARGALLIADLIQPQRAEARQLFAATWDQSTEAQSLEKTGSPDLYQLFVPEKWNYYLTLRRLKEFSARAKHAAPYECVR